MTAAEIAIAVLTGGVVVAVIEGIREALAWKRKRKAEVEDRAECKAEEEMKKADRNISGKVDNLEIKVDALVEANKFILYDRIRFLGQTYIDAGEIDFDDRRILNNMHKSYHYGLNGNGDLDVLMAEVNHLPLKHRGE